MLGFLLLFGICAGLGAIYFGSLKAWFYNPEGTNSVRGEGTKRQAR